MSELEKQVDVENENDNAELETNYQPPPQKTIEEIIAADQEDESLRKYKEALLGAAQTEKIIVGECCLIAWTFNHVANWMEITFYFFFVLFQFD